MEKIRVELTQEQFGYIKNAYKYIELGIDHCPSNYDLETLGYFGCVIVDIQSQIIELGKMERGISKEFDELINGRLKGELPI